MFLQQLVLAGVPRFGQIAQHRQLVIVEPDAVLESVLSIQV
jgi:hypothetical protein